MFVSLVISSAAVFAALSTAVFYIFHRDALKQYQARYSDERYHPYSERPTPFEDAAFFGIITGSIALIITIIMLATWSSSYFRSYDTVSELQAFYNDTALNYQYTVTATNEINIPASQPGLIDIAHQGQAVATSERLKELRDKVTWYNAELSKLDRCEANFFLRDYCADPGDLKFIRITN